MIETQAPVRPTSSSLPPLHPYTNHTTLATFPAIYLCPLNIDLFVKHINLTDNERVKIGRQTNARTVPAENNDYFESRVLSWQHAEVWEESGKVSNMVRFCVSCLITLL